MVRAENLTVSSVSFSANGRKQYGRSVQEGAGMLYTKAPFSLANTKNETFLYSQKGIFVIDNPSMIGMVNHLQHVSLVEESAVLEAWEQTDHGDISFEDVLNYLTTETQVLIQVQPEFKKLEPLFVSSGSLSDKITETLFQKKCVIKKNILHEQPLIGENRLYVIDMLRDSRPEEIEETQAAIGQESTCIYLFLIGDYFVISHAYSKKIMLPCILCLYDYVMERVLSDNKNKISSLASVIDYINGNYNIPAPAAPADDLDHFYLMRELRQYILTLTGDGRCAFTGCDVNQARVINIHTLEKADLAIPFSPRCNCMYHYHSSQEQINA